MDITKTPNIGTIAIFGASGATGLVLTKHALKKGIAVNALVRHKNTANIDASKISITEGSIVNSDDVDTTVNNCNAVICVFGPRPPYTDVFCEDATKTIIASMHKHKVSRLLCQTGAMIGEYSFNRTLPFRIMSNSFSQRLPFIANDRNKQEEAVINSGLIWTIVKPPRLTNGVAKGKCYVGTSVRLGLLSSITREDLADFLLSELLEPKFVDKAVFIKN